MNLRWVADALSAAPAHLAAAAAAGQAGAQRRPGPLGQRRGDLGGRVEATLH
jgi:hypothetical protein